MSHRILGRLVAAGALALGLLTTGGASAEQVTPGNFTGYGFDQCLAPTQSAMDTWLASSPYWAVGIYISGDSRACRNQPNLTPAWITAQLRNGWRLLPITLGPQASCSTRFPRYGDDETIKPSSAHGYRAARRQGRAEATDAVEAATALGIGAGSTLWYDIEAYDIGNTACRESALAFTSGWTTRLHTLGYVSGVYSSAGSGIKALDDVRATRPSAYVLPDRVWIARWDGQADTSTGYLRADGWQPGGRVKQYRGGHNETHGGVTINIDTNWLDLGSGSTPKAEPAHCGSVRLNRRSFPTLRTGATGDAVTALQCLLTQAKVYDGPLDGAMSTATQDAVAALRAARGLAAGRTAGPRVWTSLHAPASTRIIKYGAVGERVRRLQRALNAASAKERLPVTGVFAGDTTEAVKRYQSRQRVTATGVVTPGLWRLLYAGRI